MDATTITDPALQRLLTALTDPGIPLAQPDLDSLANAYPYFVLPAVMALKGRAGHIDDERRRHLTTSVALNISDTSTAAALLGDDLSVWVGFYPPQKPKRVTTDQAIDTFLNTYGRPSKKEDELLERLIFNPVPPDYAALLDMEQAQQPQPAQPQAEPAPAVKVAPQQQAEAEVTAEPQRESTAPSATPTASTASLSESLAKIYIKQRRFDKAYEIIRNISLNNPKKSVYFADQLRFLQKLMINQAAGKTQPSEE